MDKKSILLNLMIAGLFVLDVKAFPAGQLTDTSGKHVCILKGNEFISGNVVSMKIADTVKNIPDNAFTQFVNLEE